MQFATISRTLIDRLSGRGPFFQSAFPDYYAMNAAFLAAHRIVVDPAERVAIGVTPKSYGFFHVNRREGEGKAFLGAAADDLTDDALERAMLPGSNINAGWLSAMLSLTARYGDDYDLRADVRRFRMLQAEWVVEQHVAGEVGDAELADLRERLTARERRFWDAAAAVARPLYRITPGLGRRAVRHGLHRFVLRQIPFWDPPCDVGYSTLLDLFERRACAISSGTAPITASTPT